MSDDSEDPNPLDLMDKGKAPFTYDGNAQHRVRLWYWAFISNVDNEDFGDLISTDALDWVIVPMPHF